MEVGPIEDGFGLSYGSDRVILVRPMCKSTGSGFLGVGFRVLGFRV